jgi:PAS domain S-box-containing protein
VLDHLDLAVIATDADGFVRTWNPRAELLYGWSADQALGSRIRDMAVPEEAREATAAALDTIRSGKTWEGLVRLRRRDGSIFTAFLKSSPIFDEDGAMIGVVGCSIEIGEPRLNEAARAIVGDGEVSSSRRTRNLSPREREVLALLARGLTGEQIAERLVLSPETVRTHIRNAREKLGASTRVEAVTMALVSREIAI